MRWYYLVVAFLVVLFWPRKVKGKTSTLGFRNNNPFNIVDTSIPWDGVSGSNQGHEVFNTLEDGIRAGFKNLRTAYYTHGRDTIRKIVSKWATGNLSNYIKYVSGRVGVDPDQVLSFVPPQQIAIGIAMIDFENGSRIDPGFVKSVYDRYF